MSNDKAFSVLLGKRPKGEPARPTLDQSKVVIVIGDFTGMKPVVSPSQPTGYQLIRVSHETLDRAYAEISPELEFSIADSGPPSCLRFNQLDDFHPDQLLQLLNIPHSHQYENQPSGQLETTAPSRQDEKDEPESQEQTLDRLLGKRAVRSERAIAGENPSDRDRIQSIVQRLARQAVSDAGDASGMQPRPDRLPRSNYQVETDTLRRLLHDPEFQHLEASWRGLDWLLRSVESDQEIDFWILDCARNALLGDGSTSGMIEAPDFQALLSERCGAGSNTLLLADYLFEDTPEDLTLLTAMGHLAARLDARLIAGVGPTATRRLWETNATVVDEARISAPFRGKPWSSFRQTRAAKQIKLALPRVLLRIPYGKATDPIDTFEFEELPQHTSDHLLWGNPAYACVILQLAQSRSGAVELDAILDDMPAYSYRSDGETLLQPATEYLFAEGAIEYILALGLIPLLGSRRSNKIRIPWQQSIAGTV